MTLRATVAVPCGDTLGESAAWSVREQALYWVDIRAPALHRFAPDRDEHLTWALPELCGGVVPTRSGVVLALRRHLVHFTSATGRIDPICAVEDESLGNRLNEIKCDRAGRLWVGSMRDFGAATTGSLYRVGTSLRPERVLTGITIPNGLGWAPNGRTMYFADTADGAIRAIDCAPGTGDVGEMHVLTGAGDLPGKPDGCAVDAEGHVWTTRVGAGQVMRIAPDGRVGMTIALPTDQPTSCAFGGGDLRTLFITTARQRLSPEQLRDQPTAGHLFAATVEVPGLAETEFEHAPQPHPIGWEACV